MITVKVDISSETAKRLLADIEKQIGEMLVSRDALSARIEEAQKDANSIREQLKSGNGVSDRKPAGENKTRIVEYLKTVGENGARLSDIHKATGISLSSINFTLKSGEDFVKAKKLWKLKA